MAVNWSTTRGDAQRVEDALASMRDRGRVWPVRVRERSIEGFDRRGRRQIALVELTHAGEVFDVDPVRREVGRERLPALDVGLEALDLRVRDEHDGVRVRAHRASSIVEVDRSRNGHQREPQREPADGSDRPRHEIEGQPALVHGGHVHHRAPRLGRSAVEEVLKVGRLAAERRAVVDDLAANLAGIEVDGAHFGERRASEREPQGTDTHIQSLQHNTPPARGPGFTTNSLSRKLTSPTPLSQRHGAGSSLQRLFPERSRGAHEDCGALPTEPQPKMSFVVRAVGAQLSRQSALVQSGAVPVAH
jgi:hypothetical protein